MSTQRAQMVDETRTVDDGWVVDEAQMLNSSDDGSEKVVPLHCYTPLLN